MHEAKVLEMMKLKVRLPSGCAGVWRKAWALEKGLGFRVLGLGFRVQGSGFRVQGSGFRVQGSGLPAFLSQKGLKASPRKAFRFACRVRGRRCVGLQELRISGFQGLGSLRFRVLGFRFSKLGRLGRKCLASQGGWYRV